jgi:hypothetical protein
VEWRKHAHHSSQYVYPAGYLYGDGDGSEWLYSHQQYYDYAKHYSTDGIDYEQYEHNDLDLFSDKH